MHLYAFMSIGLKGGNLSPLALVKNEYHEVFYLVPLRGEVSESVPPFRPILMKAMHESILF